MGCVDRGWQSGAAWWCETWWISRWSMRSLTATSQYERPLPWDADVVVAMLLCICHSIHWIVKGEALDHSLSYRSLIPDCLGVQHNIQIIKFPPKRLNRKPATAPQHPLPPPPPPPASPTTTSATPKHHTPARPTDPARTTPYLHSRARTHSMSRRPID